MVHGFLSLLRFSLLTFAILFAVAADGSAQSLVIRGVTVVDVRAGALKRDVNVVVEGGKITSVGKAAGPAGAQAIDGRGKFLIPGLWEMHAHVWEKESLFYLYLASGVTGVRDLGSAIRPLRSWEAEVRAGNSIGPRIVTAGAPVDGPGPNNFPKLPTIPVSTAAEGRAAADQLKADGVDFIKPLSVPRDAYFALTERARALGMIVAGHVPSGVSLREAVDAGQRTVEHLSSLPLACSSDEAEIWKAREAAARSGRPAPAVPRQRLVDTFSETRCRAILEYLRQKNVWVTPTLASAAIRNDIRSGAARNYAALRFVPAGLRAEWESPATPPTAEQLLQQQKDFDFNARLVRLMQDVGVGILAGTDSGDPYVVPGFALHRELELLVKAGLTPAQALRTATSEPARLFGKEAELGAVESGKDADLVLLNANPLADIRNTLQIGGVIVKGRLLDRAHLDRMLSEMK